MPRPSAKPDVNRTELLIELQRFGATGCVNVQNIRQ